MDTTYKCRVPLVHKFQYLPFVTAKYCILRWKSLRGKYRREVGKLGKESGWELLERMKFIDKHIKYQG